MELLLLTAPEPIPGEIERITRAIDSGDIARLHLRRPSWSAEETADWLEQLPERILARTVLHDHHELVDRFPALYGIHLNRRHPDPPQGYRGHLSCSCHSLDEVRAERDRCDYLFLSPIFDSISKQGYRSAFSLEELEQARSEGLITRQVYALGGVTRERLPLLEQLGFGGAALLGAFWRH